jgi:DNA-binding transcriptional LysR family regulator
MTSELTGDDARPATEPGWELYRSFLGVLEEGSLSGAARAMGLAQPTVGRHIDALESALGCTLFTRSQQGFRPTEAALALRPYAHSLRSTAAALLRVAASQGAGVRGTVRITASEVISVEVLPPVLAELRRRHPALVIELHPSNSLSDLLQHDADIAVRMVRPTQEALVARRVGTIEVGLFARRSYLAQHGTPTTWDELAGHALIGFDRETAFIRSLRQKAGGYQRRAFALRSDSDLAQLAALRAGFGIGACQVPLARADRRLVRVLPDAFRFELDTWIAMHEDLRDSARCKAVFDALVAGLQAHIDGPGAPAAAVPAER